MSLVRRLNIEIGYGSTRTVLLIGKWAVKFPCWQYEWRHFLWGLLANHTEYIVSRMGHAQVCPVLWTLPLQLIICMPRTTGLSLQEFMQFDYESFIKTEDERVIAVENKLDSFGWLDGRIVAVDYGN
jgi:hypothetical protein